MCSFTDSGQRVFCQLREFIVWFEESEANVREFPCVLFFGELSRRDSKGLNYQDCEVLIQSTSRVLILQEESVLTMIIDVGVGDQEITFKYPSVSEETR